MDPEVFKAVQGDAQVNQVDHSNDASIKHALTGVNVVISTITTVAVDFQVNVAATKYLLTLALYARESKSEHWTRPR